MVVAAAALVARAEGVGTPVRGGSNAERLLAATTILSAADGLIAIGGPELRRLPTGALRWETLHVVPGDSTYRVAADGSGRLLVAWEKEPLIHFFAPARRQHVAFPKPTAPGPDVTSFQLDGLELSPDGRAALVFMTGIVRITPGKLGNPSSSTSVYRIALDERTGAASPARLLFRLDHGYRLHASPRGAVFAMNKNPGAGCDHQRCSIAAIVAYEISGDRATPKTLFDGAGIELQRARLVRGSDDDRIAVMLDAGPPKRLELVRWRYGDPSAQFRTLPFPARDDLTTLFITKTDELVELRRGDDRIELYRHGAAALEPIATLGALQSTDLKLHGFGERPDGGLWLHWGDHLGLVSPGKPPRSFALEASLPRRCEWASADIYVKAPEHLWVGIDGRGRDFMRVSFADVERRAQPWPAASLTGVKGLGGEGDVTYAKDPSTATRLYATTSLRAVPGGLIAIGGPALRRLAPGASRWEKVHEVPGDSVYRVAADGAGRVLASWEKEPVIHLFSFAQRQHVALPKPNLPFTVEGKTYNALHVDEVAFAPNGRDAIVFTMGQVGASSRWITAAHYVALDGKSEPRPIFRVDEGVKLHSSWHGAVFAVPQDPKQECSHQRCWPIRAIVAYEISGERVTQRTLLDGAHVDMSGARPVYGSDDDHVGMVLDLVRRDGVRRLNGGRALLRWRWGDAQADYRPLPGNSALTPVWRIDEDGRLRRGRAPLRRRVPAAGDSALSPRDR